MPRSNPDAVVLPVLIGLALLLGLPLVLSPTLPGHDTAAYYSRLVQEVGAANWAHAFHPALPPLFGVAGGGWVALGLEAFTAAKLTSTVFLALTVWPLYLLCRDLWDRRVAVVACLLFILSRRLLHYAGEGELTTSAIFFFTLTVFGLCRFAAHGSWGSAVVVGVGSAGLALARTEGVVFAGLALAVLLALAWRPAPTVGLARGPLMGRALSAALVTALLLAPWVAYEYRQTGYPVTDVKQTAIFKLIRKQARRVAPDRPPAAQPTALPAAQPTAAPAAPLAAGESNSPVIEAVRGYAEVILIFGLPVIVWRWRRRTWTRGETLLLGAALAHAGFFLAIGVLTGVTQKRYFVGGNALLAGWAALGLLAAYGWWCRRWLRLGAVSASLLLAGLAFHEIFRGLDEMPAISRAACRVNLAFHKTFRGRDDTRSRRKLAARQMLIAMHDAAAWLRTAGRARVPPDQPPLRSSDLAYHNGRQPVVLSIDPAIALLARADWVFLERNRTYALAEVQALCTRQQVNYISVEPEILALCPDLGAATALPPAFSRQYERWAATDPPLLLLGYEPNLRPLP